MFKRLARVAWDAATHAIGRASGRYYFEDFVRVYPDDIRFDRLGRRRVASDADRRNFLNHQKFYRFAAQFVAGRRVADIGCGSGYGCAMLKSAGAVEVCGTDVSRAALAFASKRFARAAEFSNQSITDLNRFRTESFDVTISSEVLEHIKEYGREDVAVAELRRVSRVGGIVIIATPNTEMLEDHGFSFEEMSELMNRHFKRYVIFENALIPFGERRQDWERRRSEGRTGTVVTEAICGDETRLAPGAVPETKVGATPGIFQLGSLSIDTTLLHNTHSWVSIAVND